MVAMALAQGQPADTGTDTGLGSLLPVLGIAGLGAILSAITGRAGRDDRSEHEQLFDPQGIEEGPGFGELFGGFLQNTGSALAQLQAQQAEAQQAATDRQQAIILDLLKSGRISPEDAGGALEAAGIQLPQLQEPSQEAAQFAPRDILGGLKEGTIPPDVANALFQGMGMLEEGQTLQAPPEPEEESALRGPAEKLAANPNADPGVRAVAMRFLEGGMTADDLVQSIENRPEQETEKISAHQATLSVMRGMDPEVAEKLSGLPAGSLADVQKFAQEEEDAATNLRVATAFLDKAFLLPQGHELQETAVRIATQAAEEFEGSSIANRIPAGNLAAQLRQDAEKLRAVDPQVIWQKIQREADDPNDPQLQQVLEEIYGDRWLEVVNP